MLTVAVVCGEEVSDIVTFSDRNLDGWRPPDDVPVILVDITEYGRDVHVGDFYDPEDQLFVSARTAAPVPPAPFDANIDARTLDALPVAMPSWTARELIAFAAGAASLGLLDLVIRLIGS
jgi:hypothetical protein